MQGPVIQMELTREDEATAMLARLLYIHFSEHRDKDPRPAPFARVGIRLRQDRRVVPRC